MDNNDELIGKKIKSVPKEGTNIGMDVDNETISNIVNLAINKTLNTSDLENFLTVAQTRESIYQMIDIMLQDSTISAIVEAYAENATEPNSNGDIVWVESENQDAVKYISFLLSSLQINKKAFNWMSELIKYGDVYLKLFKNSEMDDDIFDDEKTNKKELLNEAMKKELLNEAVNSNEYRDNLSKIVSENKDQLDEDLIIKMQPNDHYSTYVELVKNPGEMFELDKNGKIRCFIKAPYNVYNPFTGQDAVEQNAFDYFKYTVNKSDVEIYSATSFVHGLLEDTSGRTKEEVSIVNDKVDGKPTYNYEVNKGKSLLYDWFKDWRELTLLENSIILNRLTKSSIVRLIQVQVGDMPKEMVAAHLQGIKSMMEQKSAIDTGKDMTNYTNPGPAENNIYIPVHGDNGTISIGSVGGDYDPKQLTDLEYFRNKFFSGTGIPKQYLNWTDDSTGFNGGTSLSLISSQFAKRVKRIQQSFISMLTDLINIYLLDRNLISYIGCFKLRMTTPITQEEVDRRDSQSTSLGVLRDTMDILDDIETPSTRLKIIKSLLQNVTSDPDILTYIQDEIDKLEKEPDEQETNPNEENELDRSSSPSPTRTRQDRINDIGNELLNNEETTSNEQETSEVEEPEETNSDDYLPSFAELNVDSNDVEV